MRRPVLLSTLVAVTLLLALCEGSRGQPAVPQEDMDRLIAEAEEDAAALVSLSTDLLKVRGEYLRIGDRSASFLAIRRLADRSLALVTRAERRFQAFTKLCPSPQYKAELRLFKAISTTYYQAMYLDKAVLVATERFSGVTLSQGETRALEELVAVYQALSSVESDLFGLYVHGIP